jgi:hypothetical protein
MPYVLAILALVGGVYMWTMRARAASSAVQDLAGVASDVVAATRRFGFRRRYDTHPIESLEDGDVAIAGAGLSFLELAGLPSAELHAALAVSLQSHLKMDRSKAEEAMILGRWLMTESGGASAGLSRLTRRLYKLRGVESLQPLMSVLKDVAATSGGMMTAMQKDQLAEIAQIYRVS